MGDKTLNLQQFFAMSFGLSVENLYYIAIAVLACVLGAEIAGICMLVGKMRRAKSEKADATNDEYNRGGGANYALAALSFGAVSATAELALLVLAIAAAVGALVLCILLIALRAKGYLLISAKDEKAAEEQKAATPAYAPVEVPEQAPVKSEEVRPEPAPEVDYVQPYQDDEEAQKAIANLISTEDAVLSEEVVEEAPEEAPFEVVEAAEEEIAEEPAEEVTETAVTAAPAAVAPAQPVQQPFMPQGMPAYAGQVPFVEKHIIETTKEIIKETNTTTVTEDKSTNPVTEEMMKAIDALKQLEAQIRMEREIAVARPAQENAEGTAAPIDAEDEELEIEEIDTEDEIDAEDEVEREADAEENDDEYESDLFGNERIVGFDEETGCYIIARYRKSCEAKLMQSRPATKKYYSAIRNALMGYEGTKERMSWTIDTYTNEHTQIAKINVRPRTLDLYLALEPSTLEDSVYRGRDVGSKKKYAETPFLYKVNSPRKLTLALELVQRACEEQGLSPIDIEEVNYEEQYPFTDTETLITRGLIREYLREEKPAATFELDPDHVPQLIEEDETVIPANANFTWEFDNDQPETVEEPALEEPVEESVPEEPVIVEEPAEEPVIVEEPAPVAPPAPTVVSGTTTTTTTHETIRTTERHYTEHYYGTGAAAQISEETRTVEMIPEHTAAPIEAEAEEIAPDTVEEPVTEEPVVTEEVTEEATEEVVEEAAEAVEEETEEAEAPGEVQSSVAALFGDDVFEEDEPAPEAAPEEKPEEETAEETVEEVVEEVVEEPEEETEEEPKEEPTPEVEETVEAPEEVAEEVEEVVEEEVYEDAIEEVVEEVYYEEEPEEAVEEEYYEEEPEEAVEEEYYEEEPEEVVEEEYYEEVPEEAEEEEYYEEVVEEEYYEEEPTEEVEEYYEEVYYEEDPDAVTEEEYYEEEYYEEEPEEVVEEVVEEEEVEEEPAPQPAPTTDVVLLDVCTFDDYFDNGAIINLETLKQVGLAPESATRLKVYASGELKGQFTVEANHFTLDAIKAISDADGDSIMIR